MDLCADAMTGGKVRGRRRVVEDDHINHERWLVSYADFLTLLLAFFVVMYSISQVSESKYRVLSQTLNDAFNTGGGGKTDLVAPQPLPANGGATTVLDLRPIQTSPLLALPEEFIQMVEQASQGLGDLENSDMLTVSGNERWLQIELNSSLLFDSGSAVPKPAATPILNDLARMLLSGKQPVRVEGYTDNLPISSSQFPSNWELSSARAAAIVRGLIAGGVSPDRLSAVGFGDQHAVADNMTPEGRAANRRVVLMIAREEPKMKLQRISLDSVRTSTSPGPSLELQQAGAEQLKPSSSKPVKVEVWLDQLLKGIAPKRTKRAAVKVPLLPPKKKAKPVGASAPSNTGDPRTQALPR